jgi:hypothetical protein
MSILLTLSILGSIASIIGLLLPASNWKTRGVHVLYGLVVVALSYALFQSQSSSEEYSQKLARIQNIEATAKELSGNMSRYTSLGYIHASLTFLEKHKELYPDTYERAKAMCEQSDCTGSSQNMDHKYSIIDVSFAFSGMLRGIMVINRENS